MIQVNRSTVTVGLGRERERQGTQLLANLSWVDFDFGCSTLCLVLSPDWADGKLAELAEQLGKMVEHPKSKSTQPRFARIWVPL